MNPFIVCFLFIIQDTYYSNLYDDGNLFGMLFLLLYIYVMLVMIYKVTFEKDFENNLFTSSYSAPL